MAARRARRWALALLLLPLLALPWREAFSPVRGLSAAAAVLLLAPVVRADDMNYEEFLSSLQKEAEAGRVEREQREKSPTGKLQDAAEMAQILSDLQQFSSKMESLGVKDDLMQVVGKVKPEAAAPKAEKPDMSFEELVASWK
ncbi:unnamed protein product [Effrenium voratum]|uniref:Uncharacterized protein n=1 Tax=Effrenium voratum TaxID=2562239 RepID=A0AA36MQ73_9DINO|nr:unnamed protein product [Effrenium voratum]